MVAGDCCPASGGATGPVAGAASLACVANCDWSDGTAAGVSVVMACCKPFSSACSSGVIVPSPAFIQSCAARASVSAAGAVGNTVSRGMPASSASPRTMSSAVWLVGCTAGVPASSAGCTAISPPAVGSMRPSGVTFVAVVVGCCAGWPASPLLHASSAFCRAPSASASAKRWLYPFSFRNCTPLDTPVVPPAIIPDCMMVWAMVSATCFR